MICPVPHAEIAQPELRERDSEGGEGSLSGERTESRAQGKGGLGGQVQEDTEPDQRRRCPDSGVKGATGPSQASPAGARFSVGSGVAYVSVCRHRVCPFKRQNSLVEWFSKCDPWTSGFSTTWGRIRNTFLDPFPDPLSQRLVGPSRLC